MKQLYATSLVEMAEFVGIHWHTVNRVECLLSMLLRTVSVEQSGLGHQWIGSKLQSILHCMFVSLTVSMTI